MASDGLRWPPIASHDRCLRLLEDLSQECAPAVCLHLLRLELSPGRVALPWIYSGFSTYLPAEQVHLMERPMASACV